MAKAVDSTPIVLQICTPLQVVAPFIILVVFYRIICPFSVVVLGKFRRFLLVIFLSLFLHLDFSFIYSKFSMPFWGFFY